MSDYHLAVIGAGAAGLLAATRAAERGRRVVLLEKNRKPGVKILMSGGTRCNITQATDRRGIVDAFGPQGNFLHSALAALGPDELIALFEAEGVPTKVEPTGKVFPESDRALHVLEALLRMLEGSGAELKLSHPVVDIEYREDGFLITMLHGSLSATNLLITTGGQSYPECGTTGDGYAWAKQFGHKIVPPRPALVPLCSDAAWVKELQGVTIPDVRLQIYRGDGVKPLADRRGSFLFTHFGMSGPVAMDVSRVVTAEPNADDWRAECDFVPHLSDAQVAEQLAAETKSAGKRTLGGLIADWLPRRLSEALLEESRLTGDRRLAEMSKNERGELVRALKSVSIPLQGSLGFKKAEVTAGGVDLSQVNSSTMESKLQPNLYFAGEILDLDGPIGGYNFQSAFSTGYLAGESV